MAGSRWNDSTRSGLVRRRQAGRQGWKRIRGNSAWWVVATLGMVGALSTPSFLFATHEADHRFTVEGFVCGPNGQASPRVDVLVKDTRVSVGQTVTTDGDGYYRATLHLHNDNLGDPLLVETGQQQQHLKVQFDPKDLETERRVQVNFGSGCAQALGPPQWLLYGMGAGAVGIGGLVGMKMLRKWKRDEQRKGKRQGKKSK